MASDALARLATALREAADAVEEIAHAEPSAPGERLLTQRDAADRLQLSPQRVGELARQGVLQGRKVGRVWRFREAAIATFAQDSIPAPIAPRGDRGRRVRVHKPLSAARRRLRRGAA